MQETTKPEVLTGKEIYDGINKLKEELRSKSREDDESEVIKHIIQDLHKMLHRNYYY